MAVVANVAINVDSRGAAQKLREVADRSKQVDRAVKGSSQSLAGQSRQLKSVATSASRTTAAFNGLAGALGKAAAAFSVIQGARFVFAKTAELETQTRSLTVLTGSAQRATQIIRELQQLGAVTPFTSTELIDAAKRLQAFGVEGDKVVETTRRLADVSGATGAELEGLVTAYGQVQAKGRLQGEELLQFQERGVALQQVLREQYGLTGEEFQKALEKGQISAQAVEVALLKLTDAGGKYANGAIAQSDTLAGRLSTLQDSIQNLAARLGTILAPAMQSILGLAIDIANQVNSVFETILLQRQLGANLPAAQRDRLFKQAGQEAEEIARLRGGGTIDPAVFTDLREQRFRDLMRTYGYQQGILTPPKPAAPTATPTLPKLGATRSRTGGDKADKAAAEAARAAEQQARQLKSAQDLLFTQTNQLALLRAQNEYQSAFATFGNTRAEIERKYNELLAQSKSQQETQLLQQARAAEYKQSSLTLEQRILDLNRQATQPLDDILNRLKDQAAYEREYGELIKNGTNAELAKQIIEINRAYEASVEALQPALAAAQAAVTKAEAEGASATEIAKYRKELERIQELQGGLTKKRDKAVGAATAGQAKTPSVMDNIGKKIEQLKDELNPVKVATDTIVGGATAIGNAFGQAFQDVATGAKSTQEALADAFKGIGEAFISMAAEIIAKQLVMITLQTILKALGAVSGGGGGGGMFSGAGPVQLPSGDGFAQGFSLPKLYAEGGFVTGPTQALIGEGGEPEYVIPQSKMASAMARYSRGARGEAVIPGSGGSEAATGGATVANAPIDVRYTVERINSVDYVTADQFQAGMAQAAQQGARQGEQLTLRRLQQSASTRNRLGI